MKLGGSITTPFVTPIQWSECVKKARFAAVTCPVAYDAPDETVAGILAEAKRLNVTIAEVGVWRNLLATDHGEREAAMAYAKNQLALAEAIGANCCVNIVGAPGPVWDGAYRDNYSEQTYAAIVRSIREIIDAVRPKRTFYTIEPMPWMVPDGPDEYIRLMQDVDREGFAVHMDFVNMLNSAKRFLFANEFIEECFDKLSPWIKSTHIKDARMEPAFTTLIHECAPGKGQLNYAGILRILDKYLSKEVPVLLEHMQTDEEYAEAYDYVAGIAEREGVLIF